jgi:hypothetical protein
LSRVPISFLFFSFGAATTALAVLMNWTNGSRGQENPKVIERPIASKLSEALKAEDERAVIGFTKQAREQLGDSAGIPEVPDEYRRVPVDALPLNAAEARRAMEPQFRRIEKLKFWRIGLDPTKMNAPLRGPASVVACMVHAIEADVEGKAECLRIAKEAADFLVWAQSQAGRGCFPFPAAHGTSNDRAMVVGTRFLERIERAGRIDEAVRNGWVFEDYDDGGLQFDNAECGNALFLLFEHTGDSRYLASAVQAADWAAARPLCTNWNYNAFSVHLLARAFSVTGDEKYQEAAVLKAGLGVIPGQLIDGARAGRWMDAHNARPAYHYIMMEALACLAATLPEEHPSYPPVWNALTLGLTTRNTEIVENGPMTIDKSLEALLTIERLFGEKKDWLRETKSTAALNVLCVYAAEQCRQGKLDVGPRGFGAMLRYSVHHAKD